MLRDLLRGGVGFVTSSATARPQRGLAAMDASARLLDGAVYPIVITRYSVGDVPVGGRLENPRGPLRPVKNLAGWDRYG